MAITVMLVILLKKAISMNNLLRSNDHFEKMVFVFRLLRMIALVIVLIRKISDSSKDDVNDYSHKDDVPVTLPRFFVSDNY